MSGSSQVDAFFFSLRNAWHIWHIPVCCAFSNFGLWPGHFIVMLWGMQILFCSSEDSYVCSFICFVCLFEQVNVSVGFKHQTLLLGCHSNFSFFIFSQSLSCMWIVHGSDRDMGRVFTQNLELLLSGFLLSGTPALSWSWVRAFFSTVILQPRRTAGFHWCYFTCNYTTTTVTYPQAKPHTEVNSQHSLSFSQGQLPSRSSDSCAWFVFLTLWRHQALPLCFFQSFHCYIKKGTV